MGQRKNFSVGDKNGLNFVFNLAVTNFTDYWYMV